MDLCKYKDIFGAPNTGVHRYRILDIAIVDVVSTIILALVISLIFNLNFLLVLLITLIIGEIMHYMFCVETTFIKYFNKML